MIRKQKTAWKEAVWIFGLSRLMILLFSYLAVTFLPISPPLDPIMYLGARKCSYTLTYFLLSWWRWDAVHYVHIAYSGYSQASLTAFFPLFPLLMHSVGFLLGGSVIADYAAGLILANSCFYGVLVLFYHLVSKDFGHRAARYALVHLAFAPYAIFFFLGYTESLFLLLTLAVFLFLRRGKPLDWWLAGLCGFLAALTRPTGIILMVPFLVFFMQRFGMPTLQARENWPQKLNALLPLVLTPAGLLTYMLYQWMAFGNPWLFTLAQGPAGWDRFLSFPWVGFSTAIHEVITEGPPLSRWSLNDTIFTVWPLVALIMGWKLLPFHYRVFSLAMILFVLCEPPRMEGLMSVPRFLLVVFPVFVLFAVWSKHRSMAWNLLIPSIAFFTSHVIQIAIYRWLV